MLAAENVMLWYLLLIQPEVTIAFEKYSSIIAREINYVFKRKI